MKADPLPWLLERDDDNPGVRLIALRDLVGLSDDSPEVDEAREAVMASGPVPAILGHQQPDGSFGFRSPRNAGYTATEWTLSFLADLGADRSDPRVYAAARWMLENRVAPNGGVAYTEAPPRPSAVVHCHHAVTLLSILRTDAAADPRVEALIDWQARTILGDEPIRFYKSATAGPGFLCAANAGQACGWGAVKAGRALAEVPAALINERVRRAQAATAEFLLLHDLAHAGFPFTGNVSSTWFKFGFPSSYSADILEAADAVGKLGFGSDARLRPTLEIIASRQDSLGRWPLEHTLNGKMFVDVESKGQPSKWLTLRALRVFAAAGAP